MTTRYWGLTRRFPKTRFFDYKFYAERPAVLRQLASKLGLDEATADARLSAKESLIEEHLTDLSNAHTVIDGKRLLHLFQKEDFGRGEDVLWRWLIDENKRTGVQADLRSLVLERILKTS